MRSVVSIAVKGWRFSAHRRRRLPLIVIVGFSVVLGLSCFVDLCGAQAPRLPSEEVNALGQIASKLKKEWVPSVDPCGSDAGSLHPKSSDDNYLDRITCTCNATTCHVTSIQFKDQNLTGVLPEEFANLSFLSVLDLSRNYLSGTIPAAWATLRLTQLSIMGNRISGRIPKEIGRITTLQNLTLEDNLLQGPVPPALGQLTNLSRLLLAANNLTGELPDSLGNLKNLTDFRIDGNPISGKIPAFIGNWTNLERLDMQGTLMEGPFPPIFATLKSISELRISDLKGGDGKFPPLQNMKKMKELVLRNLSISAELPDFIGEMTKLKKLDLSYNNLTGPIPSSWDGLIQSINYMFLTNNMLNGTIPPWILSSNANLDLSYNSFTGQPPTRCSERNSNLVSSHSSSGSHSIATCLTCSGKPKNYQLFINCGGRMVNVNGNKYEDDASSQPAASRFFISDDKWASSSTGYFVGNERANFITENVSVLNITNPELYTTARLSPLSLRYYGLCLQKGNYNVTLHFAEIMFTDDHTYFSVGRRLFDVLIQGQKVLQDFNIAKEANGTGKEIVKTFATNVEDTLEIHFQWAGKGTNSIPSRGVYGPLISAISVTPNFTPDTGKSKLSTGAIVGIAVGSFITIVLILLLLGACFRRKYAVNKELRGLELQAGYFSLRQIKAATRNFHLANKIGEGGFGPVYKGVLPDGSIIAAKQLSSKSKQGNREFINEIGMISALQHPNLVKLHGCCIEGNQLLLIYEYMENNSLSRALFGPDGYRLNLDWPTRRKICIGIARGLAYLHEESRLKIVHRDIKGTNILLDKDLNAKISDFGLARLDDEENTHISTRVAGTIGYMAPEYALRGYLTDKADVYSFGVVTLEIVSGMSNTSYKPKEECVYLLDWAYVLQEQENLLELVDQSLGLNYSKEEALRMLKLALLCTSPAPSLRPMMSAVVSMLEGKLPIQESVTHTNSEREDMIFRSLDRRSIEGQSQSMSSEGPWAYTSGSGQSNKEESTTPFSSESKLHSDFTA